MAAKVFIVEDDRDIREVFQECLVSEGYDVETFENGKAAIARLMDCPAPCLILLDFMMPVMDGAEFMVEFAKLPVTLVPIPVYLCSATSDLSDSTKMGCRGFIKKPVEFGILLKIVQDYCHVDTGRCATVTNE